MWEAEKIKWSTVFVFLGPSNVSTAEEKGQRSSSVLERTTSADETVRKNDIDC